MGSWNGTCGVSQLPIVECDKVALFLLKKNKYRAIDFNGCVYSDDLYQPVSTVIFGEYDDYGRVEVSDYDKRNLIYHYGKDADLTNVKKLIDENSTKNGLYFMLVHFDLYEDIIDKYGSEKHFYTNELTLRDHLRGSVLEYIRLKKGDPYSFKIEHNAFKMNAQYSLPLYTNEDIFHEDYENDKLVDDLVDLMIFKEAMSLSRKLWIPQAGNGSQDHDFEMVKLIGEFAVKKENNEE